MTTGQERDPWRDKAELAELVAVLSAAVDRGDSETIDACYAVDSFDDHGAFKGCGREFAQLMGSPDGRAAHLRMHHLLGQSIFAIDGEQAWGETFFVMHAVVSGSTTAGFGRYVDYFRRVDGAWKLAYRRVVPDATIPGDDISAYWGSRRDRGDPRYDRLTAPPLT